MQFLGCYYSKLWWSIVTIVHPSSHPVSVPVYSLYASGNLDLQNDRPEIHGLFLAVKVIYIGFKLVLTLFPTPN